LLTQRMFGTAIPPSVLTALAAGRDFEPSSVYLGDHRRWHHELISSLKATARWTDRMRHLRGVLFPEPGYVLGMYGLERRPLAAVLLPALYVHRNLRGAWKVLAGRK
jgi:hypothetical protein